MNKTVNQRIVDYSKELRLPAFRRDFSTLAKEATIESIDYEDFLLQLMEREYEGRIEP